MFKSLVTLTILMGMLSTSPAFAFCDSITSFFSNDCGSCSSSSCGSFDLEAGWRRDILDWKVDDLHSKHISDDVQDHLYFKDINSYTISGQAKWVSSAYYIRASAEYGWTYKGRAHEHFKIDSPFFFGPITTDTSDPIKRNSEVYDFDAAIGYPLTFFCCRLSVTPLIGFSFHRQHLRVKMPKSTICDSYDSYNPTCSEFFSEHSSSFFIAFDNPLVDFPSSFSDSSDSKIAGELGLLNTHRTNNYRFTWYGFYLGADIAFAMDSCWTLFWNTEFHFFDNCHRKRKSWTGVHTLDEYHKKGSAYGFNNCVGVNYHMCNNWFGTLSVDFNWWKADSKHDDLHWKKVGAKIGLAYAF